MEKLKQELEKLKEKQFMLQMCDHWSAEDYRYSNYLHDEIKRLKIKIEEETKRNEERKEKIRANFNTVYSCFIEDEWVCVGEKVIDNRKDFIKTFGELIGYRNTKDLIKEYNDKVETKMKKQLHNSQLKSEKLQRQLNIMGIKEVK